MESARLGAGVTVLIARLESGIAASLFKPGEAPVGFSDILYFSLGDRRECSTGTR
jgi:hypothetical protein